MILVPKSENRDLQAGVATEPCEPRLAGVDFSAQTKLTHDAPQQRGRNSGELEDKAPSDVPFLPMATCLAMVARAMAFVAP